MVGILSGTVMTNNDKLTDGRSCFLDIVGLLSGEALPEEAAGPREVQRGRVERARVCKLIQLLK